MLLQHNLLTGQPGQSFDVFPDGAEAGANVTHFRNLQVVDIGDNRFTSSAFLASSESSRVTPPLAPSPPFPSVHHACSCFFLLLFSLLFTCTPPFLIN